MGAIIDTYYLYCYSHFAQIEKLLGKKEVRGKVKYRVHWKGYSARHDTWEPVENLTNCQDLIDEFNVSQLHMFSIVPV